MIEQLSSTSHKWELCIVGTGPVGMAMALECDRLGLEVLVLESGGTEPDPALRDASRAEIFDPQRHAEMEIAVCRALGGTSWAWGGRCVAYDDIDFVDRPFVADAHWPLTHAEVRRWYSPAAEYLLCGGGDFELAHGRKLNEGLTLDCVERWCWDPRVVLRHRERILASEHIRLCLNSTVTGLELSGDGRRVEALEVSTPAGARRIRAHQIVLATGGVEGTRLLLATQRRWPGHFGGLEGPLGRYYMGHISGKISGIQFAAPELAADLDFKQDAGGVYYRRRLMLTAKAQREYGVLNTAFWPDNPPFYDPNHGSGVLSAVFLALAFPPTGRRLLPEAIRLAHTGPKPYRWRAHLRNAVLGAPHGATDIYRILRDRLVRKPRKPGFLVTNRRARYALHYHAEQVPHPESRIRIGRQTDAFGVPRAMIDLRYQEQDVRSVLDSHELLDRALRSNGLGRLEYWDPSGEKLRERVWAQAADGLHQAGTTRMGADPASSVVDRDLQTHSVKDLYVASSSAFPTSGQANSTLLAVALGLRLVHRLRDRMSEAQPVESGACSRLS